MASAPVAVGCGGWRKGGDTYFAHKLPAKRGRKEATYTFGLPSAAWRPLRGLKDVQVAWMRPEIGGVIEVHAQCDEHGDSDLHQYTDHLRIDWTDWKVESQQQTRLIDRAALQTVVTGRLDGQPKKLELWVVKRAGCLFDLRYVANPGEFSQGQADFHAVVDRFDFPL